MRLKKSKKKKKTTTRQHDPKRTHLHWLFSSLLLHTPTYLLPSLYVFPSLCLSPRRQSWMWEAVRATQSHQRPARTQSRSGHLQLRLTYPKALLAFPRASPPVATAAAAAAVVWVALVSLAAALREQAKAPCSSAPDRLVLSSRASWGHGSSRALTATSSTECPSRYVSSASLPLLPLLSLFACFHAVKKQFRVFPLSACSDVILTPGRCV